MSIKQKVNYILFLSILLFTIIAPLGVNARNIEGATANDPVPINDTATETPKAEEVTTSTNAENGTEIADDVADLNTDTSDLDTKTSGNGDKFEYTEIYTFTSKGVMHNATTNTAREDLWGTILEQKEKEMKKEITDLAKDKFQSSVVSIELDTKEGKSLWDVDLDTLFSSTSDTIVRVKGSSFYYIIIPKPSYNGNGEMTNELKIKGAIDSLEEYKTIVKQSIMLGTVDSSYNVYRMFPENQIALTDLLKPNPDKAKDGNEWVINEGVGKMNYSLAYYFHPIFGKIKAEELREYATDKGIKNVYLLTKADSIKVESGDRNKGSFEVDQTFLGYVRGVGLESSILSKMKSDTVKGNKIRVNEMQTDRKKEKGVAKDLVESVFPLLTMELYKESADNTKHFNLKENSYKPVKDMYISIRNNYIMTSDGDNYVITGSYQTYGITLKSLVLLGYSDKEDGDKQGGVTTLWYKEAMYDFNSTLGESKAYITGREVRFNNDYGKKMKLDDSNVDLLAIMTNRGGNISEPIRYYAFGATSGDYTTKEGNSNVGKTPTSFKIMASFETGISDGVTGFIIYRNYNYWNETGIIKHLEAQEGMAGTNVEYDKLLKLIKGGFSVETAPLTFEEWMRVKEIEKELDKTLGDYVTSAVNIICLIFAVILFFYSILVVVMYLVDCIGFFEMSMLSVITFGRLRSIPFTLSEEEVGMFSAFQDSDVKYVTWKGVVVYFVVFGVISIIFMYVQPILQLILYIFLRLNGGLTDVLV